MSSVILNHRKFPVLDAAARVQVSRAGDRVLLFDQDGTKLYQSKGNLWEREDWLPLMPCATAGAFRHNQFYGTRELAVLDGEQVHRFDLNSHSELPGVQVDEADSLTYGIGSGEPLLAVRSSRGMLTSFDLQTDAAPALLSSKRTGTGETRLIGANSADSIAVFTEGGECVFASLRGNEAEVLEGWHEGPIVFAQCPASGAYAVSTPGRLGVFENSSGTGHELQVDRPVVDLCFLSPVRLAVAFADEVNVISLDKLEAGDSIHTPDEPGTGDGFLFIDGKLVEIPNRLNTPPEARYIERFPLGGGTLCHAVRCDSEGNLVVIYE